MSSQYIIASGTVIAARVLDRVCKSESAGLKTELTNYGYTLMQRGYWVAAEPLFDFQIRSRFVKNEQDANFALVNRWLCKKALGGVETIQHDVSRWDVSALAPMFRLAKHALLDEVDEGIPLLQKLIEAGDLGKEVLKWPLLAGFASDHRFSALDHVDAQGEGVVGESNRAHPPE